MQSSLNQVEHSRKIKQIWLAPKGSWWHHNTATFFRVVRQCMGLMASQLRRFRAIVCGPKVDTLIYKSRLECPTQCTSLAQPYSSNFEKETHRPCCVLKMRRQLRHSNVVDVKSSIGATFRTLGEKIAKSGIHSINIFRFVFSDVYIKNIILCPSNAGKLDVSGNNKTH